MPFQRRLSAQSGAIKPLKPLLPVAVRMVGLLRTNGWRKGMLPSIEWREAQVSLRQGFLGRLILLSLPLRALARRHLSWTPLSQRSGLAMSPARRWRMRQEASMRG